MNVDDKGVPLVVKPAVKPIPKNKVSKLDERLSELEAQALSAEKRAIYAEKEALLRKRIREAQDRIRATQPPGVFDFQMLGGLWRKIPSPLKFLSFMMTIVVVLLIIGKSCTGSGG